MIAVSLLPGWSMYKQRCSPVSEQQFVVVAAAVYVLRGGDQVSLRGSNAFENYCACDASPVLCSSVVVFVGSRSASTYEKQRTHPRILSLHGLRTQCAISNDNLDTTLRKPMILRHIQKSTSFVENKQ